MMIDELHTPVNSSNLHALLPQPTLRDVIEPFERVLNMQGMIMIYDVQGSLEYGPVSAEGPVAQAPILVDNHPIGTVSICASLDESEIQDALAHLAHVLSLLATETLRRRNIADEVLERYDELNLIYDLAGLISSHDLSTEELLRSVLAETNRILRAEAGAIYIFEEDHSELVPISFFGRRSDEQYWQGRTRELALSTLYAFDTTQLFEGGRVICAPLRYDEERRTRVKWVRRVGGVVHCLAA